MGCLPSVVSDQPIQLVISSKMNYQGCEDYGQAVSFGSTRCFWGDHIMTPSTNQLCLGSCVSFASADVLAALVAISFSCKPPVFSKQEMIDCLPITSEGVSIRRCFGYVAEKGLHVEVDYPYVNAYGCLCRCLELRGRIKLSFCSYEFFEDNSLAISALKYQPIAAVMLFYQSFGIYNPRAAPYDIYCPYPGEQPVLSNIGEPIMHAVLVIGYGILDGVEFYIIKNSHGAGWGLNGYARVVSSLLQWFGRPMGISLKIL